MDNLINGEEEKKRWKLITRYFFLWLIYLYYVLRMMEMIVTPNLCTIIILATVEGIIYYTRIKLEYMKYFKFKRSLGMNQLFKLYSYE